MFQVHDASCSACCFCVSASNFLKVVELILSPLDPSETISTISIYKEENDKGLTIESFKIHHKVKAGWIKKDEPWVEKDPSLLSFC